MARNVVRKIKIKKEGTNKRRNGGREEERKEERQKLTLLSRRQNISI